VKEKTKCYYNKFIYTCLIPEPMIIELSQPKIDSLNFHTYQGEAALYRASLSGQVDDIFMAKRFYDRVMEKIESVAPSVYRITQDVKESNQFIRYFKQFLIGTGAVAGLTPEKYSYRGEDFVSSHQNNDHDFTEDDLRISVIERDPNHSPYQIAKELANSGNMDIVLNMLREIRRNRSNLESII